jgi:hypothetical protein
MFFQAVNWIFAGPEAGDNHERARRSRSWVGPASLAAKKKCPLTRLRMSTEDQPALPGANLTVWRRASLAMALAGIGSCAGSDNISLLLHQWPMS